MKIIFLILLTFFLVSCKNVAKDASGEITSGSIISPPSLIEGNQSLTLEWNMKTGESYTIYHRPSGAGGAYTVAGTYATSPFTISGLLNNTQYEIRIEDSSKNVGSAQGTPRAQAYDITLSNSSVTITDENDYPITFTSDVDLGASAECFTSSAKGVEVSVDCQCTNFTCTMSVKKTESFVGTLNLDYRVKLSDVHSKVGSLSGIVSEGGASLTAQAVTTLTTPEDQTFTATLPYTAPAGTFPDSCLITMPSYVSVSTPCACNGAGVCTVGLTPALNFNGTASFKFSVTAGALTSNTANGRIAVTSVDDVPVTTAQTASLSKNGRDFFHLPYTDLENDRATSCTISSLSNLSVTTACSCTSGVCTVEVEGAFDFTGAASFGYRVTANSGVSNISTYSISVTSSNTAPVATNGASTFIARSSKFITLPYTDTDGDQAESCAVSALTNVSVKTPCACAAGVCQVEVTGNQGKLGSGSFMFTVRANGSRSNTARVDVSLTCPSGYVAVNTSTGQSAAIATTLGAGPFCVMAFEAKCSGTSCNDTVSVAPSATAKAVSTGPGKPWGRILGYDASVACSQAGTNYDLISNAEWMTLAREIELEPSNWFSGIVASGHLFRGNVNFAAEPLPVNDESNPYSDTAITGASSVADRKQRRVLFLSSGDKVWDVSGNAGEWIDWDKSQAGIQTLTNAQMAYRLSDGAATVALEFGELDTPTTQMSLESLLPHNPALTSGTNYVGKYSPGTAANTGYFFRGGVNGGGAGLYAIQRANTTTTQYQNYSFRCVYRY